MCENKLVLTLDVCVHMCVQLKFNRVYVSMFSLLKKTVLSGPNKVCSLCLLLDKQITSLKYFKLVCAFR